MLNDSSPPIIGGKGEKTCPFLTGAVLQGPPSKLVGGMQQVAVQIRYVACQKKSCEFWGVNKNYREKGVVKNVALDGCIIKKYIKDRVIKNLKEEISTK